MNETHRFYLDNYRTYAEMVKRIRNVSVMTPSDLLTTRGTVFTNLPPTEAAINSFSRWKPSHFKPNQCWANGQRLQQEWNDPPVSYYEGVVWCGIDIPIDHAWNVVEGCIIDMTLRSDGKQIVGTMPDSWMYLGVCVPFEDVAPYALAHRVHGAIIDDWYCKWPYERGSQEHRDLDMSKGTY